MAGELGQWSVEVWESDEGGGESWGAIGGICVLEALRLRMEHGNGSYIWRGCGRVWGPGESCLWSRRGAGKPARWRTRDIVRMPRVAHFYVDPCGAVCALWSGC